MLVNADTGQDVRLLVHGETLMVDELGFNYNIRAVASSATWWIAFYIDYWHYINDTTSPFLLCNDLFGLKRICAATTLMEGTRFISAVPYYYTTAYPYLTIQITIKRSSRRELLSQEDTPDQMTQKHTPAIQQSTVEIHHDSLAGSFSSSAGQAKPNPTNGNVNASEPGLDGDDGEYYCVSEDFPCKGNGHDDNMVYICLYSSYRGYQTLCIPEVKSDILRYYDTSYCGPCVGGFKAFLDQIPGDN